MVEGMRNLPTIKVSNLPRMAEFVKWCVACGLDDFQEHYMRNLTDSSLALLEDDPLVIATKALLARDAVWDGTAAELMPAPAGVWLWRSQSTCTLGGSAAARTCSAIWSRDCRGFPPAHQ
jgi:hypothetical protein